MGRAHWYTRLARERFISDELQAWADGGQAEARFRRIEKAARKDFDQRFLEAARRAFAGAGGGGGRMSVELTLEELISRREQFLRAVLGPDATLPPIPRVLVSRVCAAEGRPVPT